MILSLLSLKLYGFIFGLYQDDSHQYTCFLCLYFLSSLPIMDVELSTMFASPMGGSFLLVTWCCITENFDFHSRAQSCVLLSCPLIISLSSFLNIWKTLFCLNPLLLLLLLLLFLFFLESRTISHCHLLFIRNEVFQSSNAFNICVSTLFSSYLLWFYKYFCSNVSRLCTFMLLSFPSMLALKYFLLGAVQ